MSVGRPRGDDTRARLLEAAVSAFAERGFHGTSTRDIAAAAGMSPAAVYVHHKSKEELLHQIAVAGHEETLRIVREAVASTADPTAQLRAVVHAFAIFHAEGHTGARVINYELAALSPEHASEVLALRQQVSAEIRGVVQRGLDSGAFDVPDARMTANALVSLGVDIARWYDEDVRWTPEEIASAYAGIALRTVGATDQKKG